MEREEKQKEETKDKRRKIWTKQRGSRKEAVVA
jgi:hypothetical protein